MAKLALALAAVALLLVATNATLHATVEIDEVDENQGMGKCRQEFMSQQKLMACRQFMRRQVSRGWRYEEDDVELENPYHYMNKCCNELRQMDKMCVCPSLKMAMEMMQERQAEFGHHQIRKMYGVASRLPTMCNIRPMHCAFGRTWEY